MSLSITTITESSSLTTNFDVFFFDASNNNITFTLNNITEDGTNYIFKRIDVSDGHCIKIQGFNSDQTIDNHVSISFGINQSFRIISYNGTWRTIL